MKRKLFILIFLPVLMQALPFQATQLLDKANDLYLKKDFIQAKQLYEKFMESVTPQSLTEELDKKIYQETKKSLEDLNLLLRFRPLEPLFQKALQNEADGKLKEAQGEYLKIFEIIKKENINEIEYFDQIKIGELEKYLLEKKTEDLGKYSYTFLQKVEADKARKKSVVFFGFQKDTRVEIDVETLVKNSLINTIQRFGSFNISRKVYRGATGKRFEEARKDGIDFIVMGRYRQGANNTIILNFSVLDPYRGKVLVDVQVTAVFDMNFFGTIDRIARDLERNLRSYSRFEEFSTIKYVKNNQGGLARTIYQEIPKQDIQKYVRDKIMSLEIAYLEKLENDIAQKKDVGAYALFAGEIIGFNKLSYSGKLDYELKLAPKRNPLKSLVTQEPDYKEILESMTQSVKDQDFAEFYDQYEEGIEYLEDLEKEYKSLMPVWRELKVELDREKFKIDEIVSRLGKRKEYRLGLKFSVQGYQDNFFGDSGSSDNEPGYKLEKDASFTLGAVFDKRVIGDFWLTFGLGIGNRTGTFSYYADEHQVKTGFATIDLGFKYFLFKNFSINNLLHFEPYFNDDAASQPYAEFESQGPMWFFGAEYYYPISERIDLSFAAQLGMPFDNIKLRIGDFFFPTNDEFRLKKTIVQFQLTGYYNFEVYNVPEPVYKNSGWWIGILAAPDLVIRFKDMGTDMNNGDELRFGGFTQGISLGYYFNRGLSLNLDTYFYSTNTDENNFKGHLKGIVQTLTFDLEFLRWWRLALLMQAGVNYTYFYERDLSYNNMGSPEDYTDKIKSFYFSVIPIGLGFSVEFSDTLRLKQYFQFGLDLSDAQYELLGGIKLEFKI